MNNQNKDFRSERLLITSLCLIPFLIHIFTNIFAGYGIFRDELYYIACSNRPDLGYVDQPPFSIFMLALNRMLFGDSVFALRLLPAVNSGLTILVTCLITLRLGGNKAALIISSAAVIFAPAYLGMNSIYSMNTFDILLWSIAFYLIILIIENSKLSYWIILGIIFGIGLLNKIGFLWLGFGFFAGLLFSGKRKELLTFKPYLCALIALIIFAPYIIWNFNNDFAHIEFIRNATSEKNALLSPADFIKGQILNMNPASVIIWLLGLYYFLFDKKGKQFRIIGIIYLTVFTILVINGHSKAGYLAPAYTSLYAGGGVLIERVTSLKFRWLRYIIVLPLVILGLLIAPLALPILPVETYIKYADSLGFAPSSSENKKLSELPQFYADMFGWEKLAEDVSKVYLAIPENERYRVVMYANNYGEAGAIEYYSEKYPLPPVISGHNNYWLWGHGDVKDPIVIITGGEQEDHLKSFGSVTRAAVHTAQYSMPYENNIQIFIGRDYKFNIDDVWEKVKHYD